MEESKKELNPEEMESASGGMTNWKATVFRPCPGCSQNKLMGDICVIFLADNAPPKGYRCTRCGYYIPIENM